ncbi:MAG: WG repeat-containing protein, partial [Candidatus Gastranaerophilales bacterium]|nr:WG repeat-containing protein [Candidatus Gastranaerophilales bacterium]
YNSESKIKFLTDYDSLVPMDKYLKSKKSGKYGIIDKTGNVILPPVFQKIGIFHRENDEYITGKIDGKYKVFYNTGKLIPEEELYSIAAAQNPTESYLGRLAPSFLLARDIKPEFIKLRQENTTVYKKYDKPQQDEKMVYEIQEMEVPGMVKTAHVQKVNDSVNTEISVEKSTITIDNKEYYLVNFNGKFGVENSKNETILIPEFDSLTLKKPCEHFNKPLFLVQKGNNYSIYDLKGNLLAQQTGNKINLYNAGRHYEYSTATGIITQNDKETAVVTKSIEGYKMEKKAFSPFLTHKVNEILITILNMIN